MLGAFVVTNATMTKDWNQPDDAFILVGGTGSPDSSRRRRSRALSRFPVAKAQTLAQFKDSRPTRSTSCSGSSTRCSRCR